MARREWYKCCAHIAVRKGADMAKREWCKCCAHITVRKGADNPVETGSVIERRDRPDVTRKESYEYGRRTGENAA
jgi:hypothetical protein